MVARFPRQLPGWRNTGRQEAELCGIQSITTWLKSLTGDIPADYIKPPKLPAEHAADSQGGRARVAGATMRKTRQEYPFLVLAGVVRRHPVSTNRSGPNPGVRPRGVFRGGRQTSLGVKAIHGAAPARDCHFQPVSMALVQQSCSGVLVGRRATSRKPGKTVQSLRVGTNEPRKRGWKF